MFLTLGLFSQKLRGDDYAPSLAAMRRSLGWRYERGFYEWGSHRYQLHYTNPLLVLAEFGPTEDIRQGAAELFNIILAERALMSVGGYLGGPGMRSYGRNRGCDYLDNNRYDSFLPTVWLALGVGEPRFDFATSEGLEPAGDGYGNGKDPRLNQDEGMFFATSNVTPYPEVLTLLGDVAAVKELVYTGRRASAGHPFQNAVPENPRSHQILYYYNTPHISMGSLQYLDYAGKMSVSYNSRPRFFSILFPDRPEQVLRTELSEEELRSADPQKYNYTADRVVQHRNWLLAAGTLSASHGLSSRTIGPWELYEVGKGLCAHVDLGEGWHVFQVSDLDTVADAATFVATLNLPVRDSDRVTGVTTDSELVSVELATMAIDINGVRREPQTSMLHDTPFLHSTFGSGVITLKSSAGTRVFDKHVTFPGSVAGG